MGKARARAARVRRRVREIVGWVERSETHHLSYTRKHDGFRKCSTHPTRCDLREARCDHALRHCERSEAIQSLSAVGFWIASLRSQ